MKQIKLAKGKDKISERYVNPKTIADIRARAELYDDLYVTDEEIDNILFALCDLGYLEANND